LKNFLFINAFQGKKEIGLEFKGTTKVKHNHEVFLLDIGMRKLEYAINYPLKGLKVAIHWRCYLI